MNMDRVACCVCTKDIGYIFTGGLLPDTQFICSLDCDERMIAQVTQDSGFENPNMKGDPMVSQPGDVFTQPDHGVPVNNV